MAAPDKPSKLNCPYGFNGTQEQLLHALQHGPKRESLSSKAVREAAAWLIEQKDAERASLATAMKVIVGASCYDPDNDEGDPVEERLQRISDMARVSLGIPL